jgi:hypothetical protein
MLNSATRLGLNTLTKCSKPKRYFHSYTCFPTSSLLTVRLHSAICVFRLVDVDLVSENVVPTAASRKCLRWYVSNV